MSIHPVSMANSAANNPAAAGASSASSTATNYQSMFMKLLATELQSQDPTQTMDPTTMVTQMVQINQLNDLSGIYSLMQGASNGAASGVGSTNGGASNGSTTGTGAMGQQPASNPSPFSSSPNQSKANVNVKGAN